MKNDNRNAIRVVLKPSIYPMVLVTSHGTCICSDCAQHSVHELISDLRSGYTKEYKVLCLAETDASIYCECCEQRLNIYEDLAMDPDEAEAEEATLSLYDTDSDL